MELDYELNLVVNTNLDSEDYVLCKRTEGIAQLIRRGNWFAQDAGGKLYYYKDGVYKPKAERAIDLAVSQLLAAYSVNAPAWSTYKANQVFQYIRIHAAKLLDRPDINRINLKNGIFDVRKGELVPHDPQYRTTIQLNVWYDAEATCPNWDKFIDEVFVEETKDIAYEIAAWLMVPYTELQKSVVLLGGGANGKSIYLNGIYALLGEENFCNVSLQKLSDRFTTTLLIGKLANISPDLPNTKITSTAEFKALTGGDSLAGEYKNGDQFKFTPFARCLFACNELPETPDVSDGFYRRLNIIEFERKFKDDPELGMKLKAITTTREETAGLFNKAVEVLPKVISKGLTVTEKMKNVLEEHRKESDPVAQWLEEFTIEDENDWIARQELFLEYKKSGNTGKAARNAIAFGRAIKRYRPNVGGKQRRVDGLVVYCYEGIRLKTEIEDFVQDSSDEPTADIMDEDGNVYGEVELIEGNERLVNLDEEEE